MFCINCGAQIIDGAKFCQQCGSKLNYDFGEIIEKDNESEFNIQKEDKKDDMLVLKLGSDILRFDPDIKYYTEIQKYYFELTQCEENVFGKHYDNADIKCLEDVIEKIIPLFINHMSSLIDIGFERLLQFQIHEYSKQQYTNNILEIYNPEEVYSSYIESADMIAQWAETQKIVHDIEKQTRGKWVGGGFGIKGAIKGAIQAGAMNMATNALRGVGDCVKSATDKAKLAQLRMAAFPDDTKLRFVQGIKKFVGAIKFTEILILNNANIVNYIDFDTSKAETELSNYKLAFAKGIETDHMGLLYSAIRCLNINPFNVEFYGDVYNIGKIYWKSGKTDDNFFNDLYQISKKFEVFEQCVNYVNAEEQSFFNSLLDEMTEIPQNVDEKYAKLKKMLEETRQINPYFDIDGFINRADDKIKLYQTMLQEKKERVYQHEDFVKEYDRLAKFFDDGKFEEIWECAKNKNAVAEYLVVKYYEENLFADAIENGNIKEFDRKMEELKCMDADNSFVIYLSNILTYKLYITDRRNVSGAEKIKEIIIQHSDRKDACFSAIAQAGFWLSSSEKYKERQKEGISKLKSAAKKMNPVAMAWYGSYIIEKSKGVVETQEYGKWLIEMAVYSGQKYAEKINKKYNFGYEIADQKFLKKEIFSHKIPDKIQQSCLVENNQMIILDELPQQLVKKYFESFRKEIKDIIFNNGREIELSKEIKNLRNSFGVPPEEKIYLAISANLFGHFKEGMQGLAVGTMGIYYKGTFLSGKGLIPWSRFIKLNIYEKSGFFIGDVGVVSSFDKLLKEFFVDLQNLCKGNITDKKIVLSSNAQGGEEKNQQSERVDEYKICPQCKKNNQINIKFCTGCGYSFIPQSKCPKCGHVVQEGKKFCSVCGEKLL